MPADQSRLEAPCPDDRIAEALAAAQADDAQGLGATDELIAEYPGDPRLHFLKGSLLAGLQRYDEAKAAMQAAIAIAPAFALARYQLGFLHFTSGEAVAALAVWGPLHELPEDHYLRLFAQGLTYLAADDFAPALETLRRGMEANTENPAMNGDIGLLVVEVEKLGRVLDVAPALVSGETSAEDGVASATHLLLQKFGNQSTRH